MKKLNQGKKSIAKNEIDTIVIGASAGGIDAIEHILAALPQDFPSTIIIVQHLHPTFKSELARIWGLHCKLTIKEAEEKELAQPGKVYIAPANYHLLLEQDYRFSLSTEERVNYSRPSINVLFETAAIAAQGRLMGIVLTGANTDGSHGLKTVKDYGGIAVVQDPHTAKVPIMPQAAIDAVATDYVLPLEKIGPFLAEMGQNRLNLKK